MKQEENQSRLLFALLGTEPFHPRSSVAVVFARDTERRIERRPWFFSLQKAHVRCMLYHCASFAMFHLHGDANVIAQRPLLTIVCIQDEATRSRCLQFLRALKTSGRLAERLPRYEIMVCECLPDDTLKLLVAHFEEDTTKAAVLVSDLLAEALGAFPNEMCKPTEWAKEEILDKFEDRLLGTLAIMDRERRVPDIDRVLWQDFDTEDLLRVLGLVADKLIYISPPDKTGSLPVGPIVVRPINDKTEMRDYFLLRHRVYCVMGYLEQAVDWAPSGMEINAADTHALHIGAFANEGTEKRIIGTARVVSMEALDNRCEEWARSLARADAVLKTKVDRFNQLRLPIFESMVMNDTMANVLTKMQNCGELSRVIVAEEYRGQGISELLVWFAILQAANHGVSQLLLECLPIHERLYRKFGFVRIQGVTGRVIGVNKTMIAMELTQLGLAEIQKQPCVGRFLRVMGQQGYLQSCHAGPCVRAECDLYTRGKCTPR
jgi:predicted GNAT family N-acyltransferase